MDAIILAAGRSQRFGENKLMIPFNGNTLVEHALKFLADNDVNGKIIIVINKGDVYISNHDRIIQPVMHRLLGSPYYTRNIEFVFQDPDLHGPAAGVMAAAEKIKDDYIVLFGDNYYSGKLSKEFGDYSAIATYKELPESRENLRLAFITGEADNYKILEKPHEFTKGTYFCGYLMMKHKTLDNLKNLQPSKRGEYEITDFFNSVEQRFAEPLKIKWTDITYYEDIPKVLEYIKQQS